MNWEDELTPEGKKMWKALGNSDLFSDEIEATAAKINAAKTEAARKASISQPKADFMITELKAMIASSNQVITDCEEKLKEYVKKEQYYRATEVKTVILCHRNLIQRLEKIVAGKPAY